MEKKQEKEMKQREKLKLIWKILTNKELKFNLNNNVSYFISEKGIDILEKENRFWKSVNPKIEFKIPYPYTKRTDQLHSIMNQFGKTEMVGSKSFAEGCDIFIKPENLR